MAHIFKTCLKVNWARPKVFFTFTSVETIVLNLNTGYKSTDYWEMFPETFGLKKVRLFFKVSFMKMNIFRDD